MRLAAEIRRLVSDNRELDQQCKQMAHKIGEQASVITGLQQIVRQHHSTKSLANGSSRSISPQPTFSMHDL